MQIQTRFLFNLNEKRRWGLYPPEKTAACDQYPIGVSRGDRTWDFKGANGVHIRDAKKDFSKRQFTWHQFYFAEEPGNYPRMKPILVFKAQPEGTMKMIQIGKVMWKL